MNDRREILIEKYIEPSEIIIDGIFPGMTGFVRESWLDINCDAHSFMGQPALNLYFKEKLVGRFWFKKGVEHRDKNLPSAIEYKDEQTITLIYKKNGVEVKREIKNPDLIKWF